MLDLEIRSETENRRNATDVMRRLAERFDSERGIDNTDIERAIEEVCHCDKKQFFRDYIHGARVIDFNRYLQLIALRSGSQAADASQVMAKCELDQSVGSQNVL